MDLTLFCINLFSLCIFIFIRGEVPSMCKAAKKYGCSRASLYRICSGQRSIEHIGKGKRSQLFTIAEEEFIIQRAKENLDVNGAVPYKTLVEIIEEEIVNKYPGGKKFTISRYINTFAKRHLLKISKPVNQRLFECDICSSSYALKSSLRDHHKKVHLLLL